MRKGTCSIDDCPFDELRAGLCQAHHMRQRSYGDPLKGRATLDGMPLLFLHEALGYHGPDCILWPFSVNNGRTPAMRYEGKHWIVGRLVLTLTVGPPEGRKEAAHDPWGCFTSLCINQHHLRWATRSENEQDKRVVGTYHLRGKQTIPRDLGGRWDRPDRRLVDARS